MSRWQFIMTLLNRYGLKFKTYSVSKEWDSIPETHGKLKCIALFAAYLINRETGEESIVTDIHRSNAEQLKFKKEKKTNLSHSPHEVFRAIDFRMNHILPKNEIQMNVVVNLINCAWPRTDGKKTALIHGEGLNVHLHIQLEGREVIS